MKYRALGHINHNQKHYFPGDQLELSSDEAKPLLEVGAVEPFNKPFTEPMANQTNQENTHV